MPELPEVETIKRQLVQKIIGKVIAEVEVNKPKQFKGKIVDIMGAKITDVNRKAKFLILDLDNGKHILIHLKMTGQLIFVDPSGKYGGGHPIPPFNLPVPNKYTHITIRFKDGSVLYFNDLRQFGWMKVLDKIEKEKELQKTGIEPLSPNFTIDKFKQLLAKKPNAKIKLFLMDQSIISGIGNIYASEICYYAHVLPDRTNKTLTNQEIQRIHESIIKVLKLAIKYNGTSANDYVNLDGRQGTFDKMLRVYNRKGKRCECGGAINKVKMGQRGTYYCDNCQK